MLFLNELDKFHTCGDGRDLCSLAFTLRLEPS